MRSFLRLGCIRPVRPLSAFYFLLFFLTPNLSAETPQQEASRRLPPVLYSVNMPKIVQSGQAISITWKVLGYHENYGSSLVLFDCSRVGAGQCGSSMQSSSKILASSTLAPVHAEPGGFFYKGFQSTLYTFQTTMNLGSSAPSVPTKLAVRFFINSKQDSLQGLPGVSLLAPGNLSYGYYDTSGRRLVISYVPSNNYLNQLFPPTALTSTTAPGVDNTEFTAAGQCVWYVYNRLKELKAAGYLETTQWDQIFGILHNAPRPRHAWRWATTDMFRRKQPISDTPTIGSIAVWLPKTTPVTTSTSSSTYGFGHVAFVEKVDYVNKTFTVTQFNVNENQQYSRVTYTYGPSGTSLYPSHYWEPQFIQLDYTVDTNAKHWGL